MGEKPRRGPVSETRKEEAVSVLAHEIVVGDHIWFPNSRRPQEVTGVVDITQGDQTLRRLVSADASWTMRLDTEIRKVQS